MRRFRTGATMLLAVLVVLSGCTVVDISSETTPTPAPTTPSETPSEGPPSASNGTVTIQGDDPPFDADWAFTRTWALLDADGPPPTVLIGSPDEFETATPHWGGEFTELLGVTPSNSRAEPETEVDGFATADRIVLTWEGDPNPAVAESIYVHELVHVIQYRSTPLETDVDARDERWSSTDDRLLETALLEGAAGYTEAEYADRYIDDSLGYEPPLGVARYANASGTERLALAPYHFGHEYAIDRLDHPREHHELYEDPPMTTSELLDGDPDSDAPYPRIEMSVTADEWESAERDRMGQLYLRVVLSELHSEEEAANATSGWVDDVRVTVESDDQKAHALAVRWDTDDDAAAFADAMETHLEAEFDREHEGCEPECAFAVEQPDDRTTVVLVGAASFVENASVSVDDDNVTVAGPGESS